MIFSSKDKRSMMRPGVKGVKDLKLRQNYAKSPMSTLMRIKNHPLEVVATEHGFISAVMAVLMDGLMTIYQLIYLVKGQ